MRLKIRVKIGYFVFYFLIFIFLFAIKIDAQSYVSSLSVACSAVRWVINILMIFVIISIIFAGYKLITSSGDSKAMQDAKTTIIVALLGGLIIYFARAIVMNFIGFICI